MTGLIIAAGVAAALVIFLAVIFIRAASFTPKPQTLACDTEISVDSDAAIDALAKLVRCKTVSYYDHSLEDDAEFEKLISMLPELYPLTVSTCPMQRLEDRALLFKWEITTTTCRGRRSSRLHSTAAP